MMGEGMNPGPKELLFKKGTPGENGLLKGDWAATGVIEAPPKPNIGEPELP
tara:strand:- start:317 stop:469 length:153 start_codon:yes stop_codon:yes gene_type:complete